MSALLPLANHLVKCLMGSHQVEFLCVSFYLLLFFVSDKLEEIFRKKKDKKDMAEDGQRLDLQVPLDFHLRCCLIRQFKV